MDAELPRAPQAVSRFDVGSCSIDPHANDMSGWISAKPLLSLQGRQFPSLTEPIVPDTDRLWALRHQFFHRTDRIQLLEQQHALYADDEIRFHLHQIAQAQVDMQPNRPVVIIDPLLSTAWVGGHAFPCELWVQITQKFCVTMLRLFQWFVCTNIACRSIWFPWDEP